MTRFFFLALFFVAHLGFSQHWEDDFAAALEKSKEEHKKILLVFSGSDWCAPCIKLDKLVWQTKEFNQYADENLVLYKADFPRKKKNQLPEKLLNSNKILAEKYGLASFPTVILLDENEEVISYLTDLKATPKSYVAKIDDLLQ